MKGVSLCMMLCLLVGVLGCSPMVEVKHDFDQYADFQSFKTFDWMQQATDSPEGEAQAVAEEWRSVDTLIRKAVIEQLDSKGLSQVSDNPGLFVAYYVGLKDKMGRSDFNLDYSQEFRNADVYKTGGGIIIIDLVDAKTDRLVWRGTADVAVNVDPTPEMVEKNVNRAVEKLLDRYPPGSYQGRDR